MRTVNPPLEPVRRGIHLPRIGLSPEGLLVLANALSLWRGLFALSLLAMSLAGAPVIAMLGAAAAMWLTDIFDGRVARRGWERGARPRRDGAVIDPLMDDLAFICGFLILFDAGAIPLWFVAGLLMSRVLFALVRMLRLTYQESFARPLFVTKSNGVVLAIGQLLLLAHLGFSDSFAGSDAFAAAVIAAMTATTAYSVYQFAIRRHGRQLVRLLTRSA